MSGFGVGVALCALLTLINVGFIWYSKQVSGPTSVSVIQLGMFVKFMLGVGVSTIVIKFMPVNVIIFAMTVGLYVCIAFPIMAFLMVKNDVSK